VARAGLVRVRTELYPATHTFDVFALIEPEDDSTAAGLASFTIDVVGIGGLEVTSSQVQAPFEPIPNPAAGFDWFRSDGVNGIGIAASQRTLYFGPNDPAQDALVLQGVGLAAPVRIASGTYTGDDGFLIADKGDGMITLLMGASEAPRAWQGPGNVVEADVVPEPATMLLLAFGALFLGARRLNRRRRQRS